MTATDQRINKGESNERKTNAEGKINSKNLRARMSNGGSERHMGIAQEKRAESEE